LTNLESPALLLNVDGLPRTIAHRTRRVYDRLAAVYPVSTMFFHSKAHRHALAVSGITDGMRILEVATGSGEMFRRLVRVNRSGETVGFDLSPNMAAHTRGRVLREFPRATAHCHAVDARYMPYRSETFDAIVCCYLLELLAAEDILQTLGEFHRVLRRKGRLTLVSIGQNTRVFNRIYKTLGKIAPAFWGRQIEERLPGFIEASDFRIVRDLHVRQSFYPSRVLVARK
jgi:ubiquinone/menaquinone biosynthesis C-methylase UbiE